MKVALAQINPTIGDCAGNTFKIQQQMEKAAAAGCSLVIFPELSVTGYPPQDLLDSPILVEHSRASIQLLAGSATGIAAVVGYVDKNDGPTGKPFFNSAALLRNGKMEGVYHKRLLPSYDVFDDERYFQPGEGTLSFECEGQKFAVTICEDAWNLPGFVPRAYATSPLDSVRASGAHWVVNLSASPFSLGKPAVREALFSQVTRACRAGVLFCNQVGAHDDLIFDGGSGAIDRNGSWVSRAAFFQEDLKIVDTAAALDLAPAPSSDAGWLVEALALGVRDYVAKTGGKGVCLGLSGGIDSSVVAAIAVRALGADKVKGVLLPSRFTSAASNEDATALAAALGISTFTLPIDGLFTQATSVLKNGGLGDLAPLSLENLQPRIRMTLLMAVSNHLGLLLLNTSNKSELATGYSTLYGDSAGALGVLGDLTKDQVYAVARFFNQGAAVIPKRCLERAPSAELREDQKDEDSLPPFAVLDPMVHDVVEKSASKNALVARGVPAESADRFLALYRQSEFKRRQFPPILRVSPHAFGRGRRMPVASRKPW